jgi:DNA-binding response OmpR family regulator
MMNTAGKRVLIVEDAGPLNRMLQILLSSKGYVTDSAYNGIEALESLEKTAADAIILDLMMPEMDGFEFYERLKSNEKYKQTPVIILSALEAKKGRERLMSMGASDYIVKPFLSNDLFEKVSTALTPSVN